MAYTLGTAAVACGVSKSTIHRAIKSGKISAQRHHDGSYTIDPAELHRVFPPLSGTPKNGAVEQEAEEEDRCRVSQDSEHADHGVGGGVAVTAREQTEGNADHQGEQERGHCEGEGGTAVVADHVQDRLVVAEGGPEVEVRDGREIVPVLRDQRPVEAQRLAPLFQRLARLLGL